MVADTDVLQRDIAEWSDRQFGTHERRGGMLAHFFKECMELANARNNGDDTAIAEEAADCVMLLLDWAEHSGYSLRDLVRNKLEICKRRRWGSVTADGSVEHIREEQNVSEAERPLYDMEHLSTVLVEHTDIESV